MNKPELIVKMSLALGEGPCWDDRTKCLFWIDIIGEKIIRYNPEVSETVVYSSGQPIGCIALREKAGLVCALQDGIYSFDPVNGLLGKLLDRPDACIEGNRFNDGKCDPAGRLFVGTMSNAANEGQGGTPLGTLFRIDPYLRATALVSGVSISNGIAWRSDCKTMYYIDSPTREVSSFDYNIENGSISNRRTVISFKDENGIPDGMTIDSEDMLWIAHWGGWKISRWNPITGVKLGEYTLPCQNVTCCTFGGIDYSSLYITTARIGLTKSELENQSEAGSVFCLKTSTTGKASFRFKG
jgi:sugar lactone lactonase YvrE